MAVREVEITLDDTSPQPQVAPAQDESEFEVFLPGEEVPSEEPVKSEAEVALENLKAEMAQKEAQSMTLEKGFGALADTLKDLKSQTKVEERPAPPPIDYEKMNADLKEKIYDNPLEAIATTLNTFVTPQQQTLEQKIAELDYKSEKLSAAANPANAEVFSEYGEEVDAVARSLGGGAGVVDKAIKIVKANHLDEIMEKKLNAKLAEYEAKVAEATKVHTSPSFTGVSSMPAPPSGGSKMRVRLTEADQAAIALSPLSQTNWIKREIARGRKFN